MVLLVGMLFFAIVAQMISISDGHCLQPSISAYYYTAVRPIFVGVLCAIGVCLIVYRGNTDFENALLDYSGFLAFLVAFVPTEIDRTCSPTNGPASDEIAAAVGNNTLAVLVIGLLAVAAAWKVKLLRQAPDGPLTVSAKAWLWVTFALLVGGVTLFFVAREFFLRYGHLGSAVALFIGIILTVVVNGFGFRASHSEGARPMNWYFLIAGAMGVTLLVCIVLAGAGFGHWVLVLEAALIAEFAVFWLVQTVELGNAPTRSQA